MKIKLLSTLLLALGLMVSTADTYAQQREAFPGAEGYGRLTTGGRGGKVYHVTNLEDSGEGSFRAAVEASGTRTIVFDVSGTIFLKSPLTLKNGNVTIAGQTAPGDGVCVADYPFSISANNVIIRFMRFRLGSNHATETDADGWDGLGATDKKNIIVDHCSVSWSIDECLSFVGCENTTVQWCIVAQSLVNSGHSKGAHGYGGNWGGVKSSYHHNLMAHHVSRCPRLGPRYTTQDRELIDIRNNVFYNYAGEGCYGGEAQKANLVNNYYKPGPGNKYLSSNPTKAMRIAAIGIRTNSYIKTYPDYKPTLHVVGTYYINDNLNYEKADVRKDNWTNGVYNQITWSDWDDVANTTDKRNQVKNDMRQDFPHEFVYTTTHETGAVLNKVLENVGASLSRDEHDATMVEECRSNKAASTGSGLDKGFINKNSDVKLASGNIWPELKSLPAPTDTDRDGMPDEWETANGLNPNDATDGAKVTADGYTNLEHYMNSLVQHIMDAGNKEGKLLTGTLEYTDNAVELPAYDPNAKPSVGGDDSEWELSDDTHTGDWIFECGAAITASGMGSYAAGSGNTASLMKLSRNKDYTITLPAGYVCTALTGTGYINGDGGSGSVKIGDAEYTLTARDCGEPANTFTHTFSTPVDKIVFRPTGSHQHVLKFTLSVQEVSSAIDEIIAQPENTDDRIFNLMGIEVKAPLAPGIYIQGGKKFLVK